jgi:hypothetical protein
MQVKEARGIPRHRITLLWPGQQAGAILLPCAPMWHRGEDSGWLRALPRRSTDGVRRSCRPGACARRAHVLLMRDTRDVWEHERLEAVANQRLACFSSEALPPVLAR